MHRERLNFESRSVSFPSAQRKKSFKRNSVRALKNTYQRPGGFEMILASVDDSLVLLSDVIDITAIDDVNLRNRERHHKFFASDHTDSNCHCTTWKISKKADNCDNSAAKSSSQSDYQKIAKIDLTGEEIIQWMGGLPIINSNKMLAYFCGGANQEMKKILPNREPYKIFSFSQKRQTTDQIITGNLIREVC